MNIILTIVWKSTQVGEGRQEQALGIVCFVFFFSVLGIEPRTLHLARQMPSDQVTTALCLPFLTFSHAEIVHLLSVGFAGIFLPSPIKITMRFHSTLGNISFSFGIFLCDLFLQGSLYEQTYLVMFNSRGFWAQVSWQFSFHWVLSPQTIVLVIKWDFLDRLNLAHLCFSQSASCWEYRDELEGFSSRGLYNIIVKDLSLDSAVTVNFVGGWWYYIK